MTPENLLVMSELLLDGAGSDRLDNAFPDLDFGPEKRKFLQGAEQGVAYAFVPVFLTIAGGAVDEELILEESRRFLKTGQILAPVVGFTVGYLKHRQWRTRVLPNEKPDNFRCVWEGVEHAAIWFLPLNLALNFLNAPDEPSDLWRAWNAAKVIVLPALEAFARSPKI